MEKITLSKGRNYTWTINLKMFQTKDNSYNNKVGLSLVLGPGNHPYENSEVTASLCINFITTKVPKETSFLRVEGWINIYVYTIYIYIHETTCEKAVELFKKGQNQRGLFVFDTFTNSS